ncbi:MAG: ATP-binding cassette subfamily F protein 3, partial [Porticoccaceae bacterium]
DDVSSKPSFFENYKAKKAKLDSLMENWEKVEAEVSNFS